MGWIVTLCQYGSGGSELQSSPYEILEHLITLSRTICFAMLDP